MLVFDAFVTRVMCREAFLTRGGLRISFEHSKVFSDGQTESVVSPQRDDRPGPLPTNSSGDGRVAEIVAEDPADPTQRHQPLPVEVQRGAGTAP